VADARYIVVEGPIASGKTRLARLLAEHVGGELLLDPVDDNPFLEDFFGDPERYAFAAQCYFRVARYEQQRDLLDKMTEGTTYVCNYLLAKDHIYACLNLTDAELSLFERLSAYLTGPVPQPDAVVFLRPETSRLMERLRRRDRPFERRLSPSYVEDLVRAYQTYFHHHPDIRVLAVHAQDADFQPDAEAVGDIVREIERAAPGTRYYVPPRARRAKG
jgi:deoxyadenosine/deoxycytidine kinase